MKNDAKNTLNWQEIGQRFRDLRRGRNYTQSQIGEVSNQLREAITRFEAGSAPASTNYALFLRNEFGASFDWLYDGVETLRSERDRSEKRIFDPHAIGARLKAIRLGIGLNKEEFGRVIGITGKAVAQYENGHRTPEIKTAFKIKRALGKPLDWIYFGDEEIVPKSRLRARATQLNSVFFSIKKKVKEAVDVLHSYLQLFSVLGGGC